jgi:hypothetical protein
MAMLCIAYYGRIKSPNSNNHSPRDIIELNPTAQSKDNCAPCLSCHKERLPPLPLIEYPF